MGEWIETRLGNLIEDGDADLQTGPFGTMLNASEYAISGIPVIAVQDIGENKLIHKKFVFIDEETAERLKRYKVLENDIIFGRKGAVERRALIKNSESGWIQGSDCIRLRFSKTVDPKFASYQFGTDYYKEWMFQNATGATMPSLNQSVLKELPIKFPSLAEQRAIASILNSLDDKIELLHRQNATLEKLAETLFRQWFVEEAKEDWEEVKLKDVTDIGIGRTPPRKESHWFSTSEEDIKWISIKDMGDDGVFISNTSEYLTRKAIETFNIPIIQKDTVVLSFKMTLGRVAITSEIMLSNEAIAHFKFNKFTPFTKEYLFVFLKTFKYDILGSTSSIVTSINSAMIKDLKITIPDQITMTKFSEASKPIFNKIKSNQNQIKTLTSMRDNLLPKLMSGEVRVD